MEAVSARVRNIAPTAILKSLARTRTLIRAYHHESLPFLRRGSRHRFSKPGYQWELLVQAGRLDIKTITNNRS